MLILVLILDGVASDNMRLVRLSCLVPVKKSDPKMGLIPVFLEVAGVYHTGELAVQTNYSRTSIINYSNHCCPQIFLSTLLAKTS